MIKKIIFSGRFILGNTSLVCNKNDILDFDDVTNEVKINGSILENGKSDFLALESMILKDCCGSNLFSFFEEEKPVVASLEIEKPEKIIKKKRKRKSKKVTKVEETKDLLDEKDLGDDEK